MEVYMGFIAPFAFNYAPQGWAQCNGQLLPIAQYNALFSLLGTTYGGDGQRTFGLPDLRGRTLLGMGQGPGLSPYAQGQMAGTENVTLNANQMPGHAHNMMGSSDAPAIGTVQGSSLGTVPRGGSGANIFVAGNANQVAMASNTAVVGGSQPHPNLQPYLAINYCIALVGLYPPRP